MKKNNLVLIVLIIISFTLTSCFTTRNTVGEGGNLETDGVSSGNWYALWGLVTLDHADSKRMAGGDANYTIEREFSVTDILINFLIGSLGFYTDSTTVYKDVEVNQ